VTALVGRSKKGFELLPLQGGELANGNHEETARGGAIGNVEPGRCSKGMVPLGSAKTLTKRNEAQEKKWGDQPVGCLVKDVTGGGTGKGRQTFLVIT